jgi:FkbM family methyltransferase
MGCLLGDVKKWFMDKGDQTHRLNYPLSEKSIVIDLGAYEGKWSEKIIEKYKCQVYAYEPVRTFYLQTKAQLAKHSSAYVFNCGLGVISESLNICLSADGSSIYNEVGEKELITLKEIGAELKGLKIDMVDLIKMNIEGAEYSLLEHILTKNLHTKLRNIQVQFHILDEFSERKRESIRTALSKTHYLTYDYPFVWENWRLKNF